MYYFYTILYILYNFIQFGLSQAVIKYTQENTEVFVKEGSILHINFYDLEKSYYYTNCGGIGLCVSQGKPTLNLLCNIVNETEGNAYRQYIKASSETNLSAGYAGNWKCTFLLQYLVPNDIKTTDVNYTAKFNVRLRKDITFTKEIEEITDPKWAYIGIAIFVIAVLIIIAQTVYILHFKKKVRRRRMESLQSSASINLPNNRERYIKMPGQIKMEQLNKEPRESGIYEALENYPVPKPEPPPIDTLPRPGKDNIESPKTLSCKAYPPPVAKKPIKNKNINKNKDDIISVPSLERIKVRKPQPLPTDDPAMYEVMTSPGSITKPESGLSRVLPGKLQLPAQAVPVFPTGNNLPVLPSIIAAAQLKPVNKSKQTIVPSNKEKQQNNSELKTPPIVLDAIKKSHPAPPVFRKPPAPLPIQPIPVHNGSISSDEEEWTYEPLSQYNQYNIYDNVPQ